MSIKKLTLHITPASTKVQHLTEALVKAISDGIYPAGSQLPSVNQLSKDHNLSRDTVFKAFRELKKRGVAESTPAKGYHVASANFRVFLFLDTYSPFKDVLYNSFIRALPKNYKVDLLFHFYNVRLFEQVILDSIGRYNAYVIMNFSNEVFHEVLKKIDPQKLLLLDLGDFEKEGYSYVCQDFGPSVYNCLMDQKELFTKYSRALLYFPKDSEHPRITIKYFKKFCKEIKLECHVVEKISEEDLQTGTMYFVIRQKELIEVVKSGREKKLKVGKDIGLLAYNDTPVYEILENGITVISTDFVEMGKKAAEYIVSHEKVFNRTQTRLIIRNSL
ncbi:MAG: GntR family transcriptional regulator [Bacteroidales bacterium]|nr:GntR family transcriptional regulator [Bacteroidales bacterium]